MILFKPIKPRKPFQSSIYRTEIKEASQKIAKGIEKDFAKTYRTWKHKPKFKTTIEGPGTKGVSITVATEVLLVGQYGARVPSSPTRKRPIKPGRAPPDDNDFRDFMFANAVRFWGEVNPDFFKGTAVEREAAAVLGSSR